MKSYRNYSVLLLTFGLLFSMRLFSQEEEVRAFNAGTDFYSSYIFRGTNFGTGPAVQPVVKYTSGRFAAGCWGSFDFNGYKEADLFFSLSLPAGFSLGMTDYYFPDYDYTDFSDTTGSHAFEVNLGFSKGGLSLSGNYILNKAGNAGSLGGDKYFEIKYSFSYLYLFLGAGDGWHSTDSDSGADRFRVCNLGLGVAREIKVGDKFSIPVNGQLIFNPDRHKMYIVAGFTL